MRIELDEKEFKNIVPQNERYMFQMVRNIGEREFLGSTIYIDPTFNWGAHVPVVGKVVAMPKDAKLDLSIGDICVIRYLAVWNALKLGEEQETYGEEILVEYNGEEYPFIEEDAIFAKVEGDGLVSLGDKVIVTPLVEEKEKEGLLYVTELEIDRRRKEFTKGVVQSEGNGYKVGDVISFSYIQATPLEQDMYKTLGKNYHRVDVDSIQTVN